MQVWIHQTMVSLNFIVLCRFILRLIIKLWSITDNYAYSGTTFEQHNIMELNSDMYAKAEREGMNYIFWKFSPSKTDLQGS
jgi:hypothetical protein